MNIVGSGRISPYLPPLTPPPLDYRAEECRSAFAKVRRRIKVGRKYRLQAETFDDKGRATTAYSTFEVVAMYPKFVLCRRKYARRNAYEHRCFAYMDLVKAIMSEEEKDRLERRLATK